MKLKTLITVTLLLASFLSIGQNITNNHFSNTNNNEVLENIEPKDSLFKEKKWKKIKKQLKKNKKRFSTYKNEIPSSKIIDTIYLHVPSNINESRLSEW